MAPRMREQLGTPRHVAVESLLPYNQFRAGRTDAEVRLAPPGPHAPTPTCILWISALMARISAWPVSELTEARISLASWIFFSQSMIWCLGKETRPCEGPRVSGAFFLKLP